MHRSRRNVTVTLETSDGLFRRGRPEAGGETDDLVILQMIKLKPTFRTLWTRKELLREINRRRREMSKLTGSCRDLKEMMAHRLIHPWNLGLLKAHREVMETIHGVQDRFGEGETRNQLTVLALRNGVRVSTLINWRKCLTEVHPLKSEMMKSIRQEEFGRQLAARKRKLTEWIQEHLGKDEFWVAQDGLEFSMIQFPGAVLVHAGQEVWVEKYVDEVEEYYGTVTKVDIRMHLDNPGEMVIALKTKAVRVLEVIQYYIRSRFTVSAFDERDPGAPTNLYYDLWEEVHL